MSRTLKICLSLLLATAPLVLITPPAYAQSNILTLDPNPSGGTVGSTVTLSVVVKDFQPINGFDISVKYDSTPGVLEATSVDFEGSILLVSNNGGLPPNVVESCINGQGLCPFRGIPGTVRVAAGILGALTSASDGPLFNIHFKVISTGDTVIHIFDDVVTDPYYVSHSTMDGTFSAGPAVALPDFTISTLPHVDLILGVERSETIPVVVTATNGFSGLVNMLTSVSPIVGDGPLAIIGRSAVTLEPDQNSSIPLTISVTGKTPPDYYLVTVNGASDALSHSFPIGVLVLLLSGAPEDPVPAMVSLNPSTVRSGNIRYLAACIELPSPFDPSTITLSTLTVFYQLGTVGVGVVEKVSGRIGNCWRGSVPGLTVRFDLGKVVSLLPGPGTYTLTMTGFFTSSYSQEFLGQVDIRLNS